MVTREADRPTPTNLFGRTALRRVTPGAAMAATSLFALAQLLERKSMRPIAAS
jgi:hypothetical protein